MEAGALAQGLSSSVLGKLTVIICCPGLGYATPCCLALVILLYSLKCQVKDNLKDITKACELFPFFLC